MLDQIKTINSQGYSCCCFRPGCYPCRNESVGSVSN